MLKDISHFIINKIEKLASQQAGKVLTVLEQKLDTVIQNQNCQNKLKELNDYKRSTDILKLLNIPYDRKGVKTNDLYDIFMDPLKCQELISKLKNKAFW